MRKSVDLLILNASELITLRGFSDKPAIRDDMKKLQIIRDGAVAIENGRIIDVGKSSELTKKYTAEIKINAEKKIVLPGFIDSHTHLVFSGSREEELTLKLEGVSYLEILKRGGGILKTVRETRKATLENLVKEGKERLNQMLKHGVTTVEAKSGYGLNVEDELKMLEAYRKLNDQHIVDVIPTLLAAHAIPKEYENNPDDYVTLIIEEIIPKVAERKLAKFNDVFVERNVFTIEQGRKILLAGKEYGLIPKIHADEINYLGGAELAGEVGAISADHLARASDNGLKILAEKGIIGVLLPTAPMVLMDYAFPNARKMIKMGVPIAIATDFNPNCWVENLQIPMFMATYFLKMTPAEVITAVTINAAHAIGLGHEIGSISVGKKADIVILDIPSHYWINYKFGINLVDTVIKNGKIVVEKGELVKN
mgnify:CR=1 FL=1